MFRRTKLLSIFLVLLFSTPVWSGVGDIYYCYGVGESTSVGNYTGQTITGGREAFNRKFTFKWTEEGLIGLLVVHSGDNKVNIPLEVIDYKKDSKGRQSFRTVDPPKTKKVLLYNNLESTQYFYDDGRFTEYNLSAKIGYVSFAQCEKY